MNSPWPPSSRAGGQLWEHKIMKIIMGLDMSQPKLYERICKTLGFSDSSKIVIRRLTSLNSKMFHMVINGCHKIALDGVKVLASASPNTYGAHSELPKKAQLFQVRAPKESATPLSPSSTEMCHA
ncbi:hypothetical protein LguiB_005886 [Lonicera macranthoides]